MTRAEVFAYLTRQYLDAHKGQTLAPVSMGAAANSRVHGGIAADDLNRRVELAVGSDGRVADCSPGDSSTGRISEAAKAYLMGLHFYPALSNGSPVDGKIEVTLAELVR
jgi:hypothetical protein